MHKAGAPARGDARAAGRPTFLRRLAHSFLVLAAGLGLAGLAGCKARISGVRTASTDKAPPYTIVDIGSPLFSMAFAADGLRGWAVGTGGTILHTIDGGKSWARTEGVPVNIGLQSVAFTPDGSHGCAVGGYGFVVLTSDAGKTWTKVAWVPPGGLLRSVALSADGQHIWIAGGEFGTMILSADGGKTWKQAKGITADDSIQSVAFSPDGVHGLVAGDEGLMYLSADGGLTWVSTQGIARPEYLWSVVFLPDGRHAWTVGDYGVIYESADGGGNWTKISGVPTDVYLRSVAFAAGGQLGLAAGDYGTILRTTDGGQTWKKVAGVPTYQHLSSIGLGPDGEHGWATGAFGTLLSTSDAGQTWQRSGGPPTERHLSSVAFAPDGRRGWAVGMYGTILLTTDGGVTWEAPAVVPPCGQLDSVTFMPDGERGWSVGFDEAILRTVDGGRHWEQVHGTPKGSMLHSVAFAADGLRGWAVGASGTLLNTTDGGRTWQKHSGSPVAMDLFGVSLMPDGLRGWAVGALGSILRTTNGGQTWRMVPGIMTQRNLRSVTFAGDGLHGMASGDGGTIVNSADGGQTWAVKFNDAKANTIGSIALGADGMNAWAVGGEGTVLRTVNGGEFWWYVWHDENIGNLTSVTRSADGQHVWAVGDHGTVLCTSSSPADSRPFEGTFSVHLVTRDGIIQPSVNIEPSVVLSRQVFVFMSLSGPRATGDLAKGFTRYFDFYQPIQGWKESELGSGVYTCHVEAYDGWNIVTEDFQFGNGPWSRFKGFMGWDIALSQPGAFAKDHGTQNLVLLLVLYCLVIAGLFTFWPSLFVLWHEKAAPLIAALPLPSKATDKVTQLAGLFLITRSRALDAVVAEFAPLALAEMEKLPEAAARRKWVAAPIQVEDEVFGRTSSPFGDLAPVPSGELYIRGLTELKRHLVNRRWWLSIEGPGGVGKSALAFQLARWFAAAEPRARLCIPQAIPIFVRSLKEGLDAEVLAELKRILELPRMSAQLSGALLAQRRVLALIDGLSEKVSDIESLELGALNPAKGAVQTHLAVMTSRRRIQISEVVKVLPRAVDLGTIDEVLSRYLDDVVGAGRFTPSQREAIREAMKGIMKELSHDAGQPPQIPMVFVKLIIQRADEVLSTGDKSETTELAEAALPKDLAALVDAYVASLLEARPDCVSEAAQARRAALACVGADGVPKLRPLAAYEARSVSLQQLEGLVTTGLIDKDAADVGDPRYKFALDPIAEYLAAKELVIAVRDGRITLADLKRSVAQFAAGSDVGAKVILVARTLGVAVD
jgi:photosystem II stability/assembly factor-like uncharacterized protein